MDKQKKLWLIIAIVVVVLIIVIALSGKKVPRPSSEEGLVPEGIDLENLPVAPEPEIKGAEPAPVVEGGSEVTSEGVVLNELGTPAVNEGVIPNAPEAPKPSNILTEEQIPENSIQIKTSRSGGFEPKVFKVRPGQAVTIVLTAEDQENHALVFKDPSLRAIAIGLLGGQSRAITFNVPTNPGVYTFVCSYPGHNAEVGEMIVTEE